MAGLNERSVAERAAVDGIDLLDPDFHTGEHLDVYARLRRDAPVAWHEANDLWSVARHGDVMAISRDPRRFCSGRGVLPTDQGRDVAPTDSIIFLDPPEHQRHRSLVSRAFTPRRVGGLEATVRSLARGLLEPIEAGDPLDFVDAVAAPLPMLVIAEMLGVPGEDRASFKVWSDAMIEAATEMTADTMTKAAELFAYFESVVEQRRRDPGDDLISVLVEAEVDGKHLDDAEVLGFCMTLLVAGNETTRNLISGGLFTLARHPDQLEWLVGHPEGVPTAVEEMLRWWTPVLAFGRTATEAVELGGQHVEAGDFVLMLYESANRDEAVFGPTADRFDIRRDPNPHMAFGFGEHFCLGASLARLEARVLFEELLGRFRSVDLVGDPERLRSVLMHSLVSLPVAFDR